MLKMVDKNGCEVVSFLVNVYDENGHFAFGQDLGNVESKFPGHVSNYQTSLTVAKEWIENSLGAVWLNDFEVVMK